jgi:hypothetical protein
LLVFTTDIHRSALMWPKACTTESFYRDMNDDRA